jgi:hypothetical protein
MSKLHALAKWKCTRIILLMKVRQRTTEGVHICVHWQYLKSNMAAKRPKKSLIIL